MIIGLVGSARSGKSSVGRVLCNEKGYTCMPFANAIRRGLLSSFPFLKREYLYENKDQGIPELDYVTGRALLQTMGHEWGRSTIHQDVWIKALESEINLMRVDPRRVVIDDVRYRNEIEWIKSKGGVIIGIKRPMKKAIYPDWMDHASENSLDEDLVDEWIVNSSDLDDLKVMVDSVYENVSDPFVAL
jgi:hypothetical protein